MANISKKNIILLGQPDTLRVRMNLVIALECYLGHPPRHKKR